MAQEVIKAAAHFIETLMFNANNHMQINSPATVVHEAISNLAIACGHDAPPRMEIIANNPQAFFMFMTRLTAQLISAELEEDERGRNACMRLTPGHLIRASRLAMCAAIIKSIGDKIMLFDNNNPPVAIRDIPLEVYNRALACYGASPVSSIEEAKAALKGHEWDYDAPSPHTKGFSPLVFAIAEYINREGFEQEETDEGWADEETEDTE